MPTVPTDPTRLDLARVHADHFCFRAQLRLDTPFRQRLLDISVDEESKREGIAVFATSYKRSRTQHGIWSFVRELGSESGPHEVSFNYWLEPEELPSSSLPDVLRLAQELEPLTDEIEWACHAIFRYAHETFAARWLELPMKVRERNMVAFDEIRGYRLVRTSDEDIAYSVIVDRPTNEDISHIVTFSFLSRLTPALPKVIFEHAVSISSTLIREE